MLAVKKSGFHSRNWPGCFDFNRGDHAIHRFPDITLPDSKSYWSKPQLEPNWSEEFEGEPFSGTEYSCSLPPPDSPQGKCSYRLFASKQQRLERENYVFMEMNFVVG